MKTINLHEETCCNCGITFALDEELLNFRKKDGKTFFCPNGHGQNFTKSDASTISELRGLLKQLQEELGESKTEARQLKCQLLRIRTRKTIWQILRLKQ